MLTDRDKQVVETLCVHVRLMTLDQIANHWWTGNKRKIDDARRRLSALAEAGYLRRSAVIAAPLPPMASPVVRWAPGEESPDFGAAAWKLQSRWTGASSLTSVYFATPYAAKCFGGNVRGKLKQEYQATHDLGVAQMYLDLWQRLPRLAAEWIGEDILAPYRKRQKLPDAIIARRPDATPVLVLEFGGAYDKTRVQDFHRDCSHRNLPYEIW